MFSASYFGSRVNFDADGEIGFYLEWKKLGILGVDWEFRMLRLQLMLGFVQVVY